MKNCEFKQFLTINNISGASGLYFNEPDLFIISDDSLVLYSYNTITQKLIKHSLLPSKVIQEHLPKNIKPDFESLVFSNDSLYAFGSGSEQNRFQGVKINPLTFGFTYFSLEKLYKAMMLKSNISEQDFNIEGVILKDKNAYFFNRGNGPNQQNGIFMIENWEDSINYKIDFYPIQLPQINNARATFSDAILFQDSILFLATAEDTNSTYEDGDISGSAIGILSMDDFSIREFMIITNEHKLEGIAFHKKLTGNQYSFWVCEDADGKNEGTSIFELKLDL